MEIRKFEDIEAWQLARELTRRIYDFTKKTKFAIDYGLKKQIKNAAYWSYTRPLTLNL